MQITKNAKTGRFSLRFRDSDGKPQSFTAKKYFPAGTSKRDAQKIANQIIEIHEAAMNQTAVPLLADCIERCIQHKENAGIAGINKTRGHAQAVLRYIKPTDTINDILRVYNDLVDGHLSSGYSRSTIRIRSSILHHTATLAFKRWRILKEAIHDYMEPVKPADPRIRYLSKDEFTKFINAFKNETAKNIMILRVLTGIRNGELERCREDWFKDGRIYIKKGKRGGPRAFEISQKATDVAKSLNWPLEMSYDVQNRYFNQAKSKCGLKDFHMHDLRHTFASWIAQERHSDIFRLSLMLGHSSVTQTQKYAHLFPEHLSGIATELSFTPQLKAV